MLKKIIPILLTALVAHNSATAQLKLNAIAAFDYSLGFATGSLNSYIPDKNFDGFHVQYRHFLRKDFTLGSRLGWNNFRDQLPRAVYQTDRGTVNAVQTRYFNSFPLLVNGFYYLRSSHFVMPFAGGGIGGYFLKYGKWYGAFPVEENSIRFGLSPEAGVIIPFRKSGIGLMLSGRFNKVFYNKNEIKNLQYAEVNFGLYFGYPEFE
jgi:opacity protein-like surface antigen